MMRFPLTRNRATPVFAALILVAAYCGCAPLRNSAVSDNSQLPPDAGAPPPAPNPGRVIHVVVALCDNVHQGIVPVPARIGNGDDPGNNLYWGAAFGVRTFFSRSADWKLIAPPAAVDSVVLERCIFKHRTRDVFLVADAYRGAEIQRSIDNFLQYAAGRRAETIAGPAGPQISAGGGSDLVAFVGHDGLMDFNLSVYPRGSGDKTRDAIILCCASKAYFAGPLGRTGARPLLWTNGLMAPEAYVLKAALDGWAGGEGGEAIRNRAAAAYHEHQHCGMKAARNLFASGW